VPAVMIEEKFSGFDISIFNELMRALNANIHYEKYPIDTGTIYENGTATGLLGRTLRGEVDVSLSAYSLQQIRAKFLSETVSYTSDKLILVVPDQASLSSLLKLAHPFTTLIWLLILAVVITKCILIAVLNVLPQRTFEKLVGSDKMKKMDVVIGIIGTSHTKLPKSNFTRMVLMQFLMFCMVIRSIYSGSLFSIMKSDVYDKEITSIDGYVDEGFDFYVYETLAKRLNGFRFDAR